MVSLKQKERNCIWSRGDTLSWVSVDALPGAFSPPGLCVVTLILGRRGLRNLLWLAKHGAPTSLRPVCVLGACPLWLCVGITSGLVALCWPLVATSVVWALHLFLWPWVSGFLRPLACLYLQNWYMNEWLLAWSGRLPRLQGRIWPVNMSVWMYVTVQRFRGLPSITGPESRVMGVST